MTKALEREKRKRLKTLGGQWRRVELDVQETELTPAQQQMAARCRTIGELEKYLAVNLKMRRWTQLTASAPIDWEAQGAYAEERKARQLARLKRNRELARRPRGKAARLTPRKLDKFLIGYVRKNDFKKYGWRAAAAKHFRVDVKTIRKLRPRD